MLIAIKDVIDKAVDDGGFPHCLITQEHDFVFQQGWDGALAEV